MAVNYTTKYSPLISDRFKASSFTENYAGKKYDFEGAQSVVVYTVDKVTLNDYNRTSPSARFGVVNELGDLKQTMTLTQDKSFTFSIDHGTNSDQLNVKHCNEQLKSNWDEVCTPAIDKYRFRVWCNGAGLGRVGAALSKTSVLDTIMSASAAMTNACVPKKNRVVFISETMYIVAKLAAELTAIDSLGEKAISNGVVGRIDGMDIVSVPTSYLPDGVSFLIKHKDASVDPLKLKTLRVQKNPPGIDGDIGECRFYHDSFVLDSKVNGIYMYSLNGVKAPTIEINDDEVDIFCETGNTVIYYTTDGTNPKNSPTAKVYVTTTTVSPGQTVRAYAHREGFLFSAISEATAK